VAEIFRDDYFGILPLFGYFWDLIRRKPHFYGDEIHTQAIDEAMKKFKDERAESAKKK